MRLLENVNLERVCISEDGKSVRFDFIDMDGGMPVGILECVGVAHLDYRNPFNEELACYVGEVNCEPWTGGSSLDKTDQAAFGFRSADGESACPTLGVLIHLHLEGQVSADVLCSDYRLTR